VPEPADAEGARQDPVAVRLADAFRLPGEQRLVEGQATRADHVAVGDQLIAGLDPHHVTGDHLLGDQLVQPPVAHHACLRCHQDGELVEHLLRLHLLADADVAVDDCDQAEQRIREQPQREHDDEEDAEDQVEEGEDVAGDDARHRTARGLGRRSKPLEAPRRLGAAEPSFSGGVGTWTIYTGPPPPAATIAARLGWGEWSDGGH